MNMISDARGGHVSPGIYTEEKDVTYSVKSLGITSLGLVGETLYGPAFENVEIENWSDFVDYFGGTSPEKFKGTGLPKYELPYIAKSYLEESKRLNVVRVLGLSGYDAGKAWVVKTSGASYDNAPLVVLRSKMVYSNESGNICDPVVNEAQEIVESVKIGPYTPKYYTAECATSGTSSAADAYDKFSIEVTLNDKASKAGFENNKTYKYNVSMKNSDSDYIYRVLSNNPSVGTTPIYIEAIYENGLEFNSGLTIKQETIAALNSDPYRNYKEMYRPAQTPWIVSDVSASMDEGNTMATLRKLFKFITISDGDASNYQVKVSIANIDPEEGTFDVMVRDYNDTDVSQVVLERFSRCTMKEGTDSYIAFKIGTADGGYVSKSKYIAVEMAEGEDLRNSIPAGFLGFPMPSYECSTKVKINYYDKLDVSIKPKRQFFGLNSKVLDADVLSYKGINWYDGAGDVNPTVLTDGFHMDSILSNTAYTADKVFVDGISGYSFHTVSADKVGSEEYAPRLINAPYMDGTIYRDKNNRKFTTYFYGGFDGWDVNREERTNRDKYRADRISVSGGSVFTTVAENGLNESLNLPSTAITSDYYAYLAGYLKFANPEDIDINVFATPGIDWYNHTLLTEDALDIIEDSEDGRGGDALYVMNSPKDVEENEIVYALEETDIDTSYAATYYPWIMYYDASNRRYLELSPTKDVVRNLASTDNTSYPWFAPAGMLRGEVKCVKALHKTKLTEEDDMYEGRINPVKSFSKDGVKIWGNKTMYSKDSPLNRINVRRLMIRVKKLISEAARNLIFEQYDDTLEKQFRGLVEPILADVKSKRGIFDYRVMTEVTPETRDQHILPARILIKPTPALEYISISFVVYPQSVDFQEN